MSFVEHIRPRLRVVKFYSQVHGTSSTHFHACVTLKSLNIIKLFNWIPLTFLMLLRNRWLTWLSELLLPCLMRIKLWVRALWPLNQSLTLVVQGLMVFSHWAAAPDPSVALLRYFQNCCHILGFRLLEVNHRFVDNLAQISSLWQFFQILCWIFESLM